MLFRSVSQSRYVGVAARFSIGIELLSEILHSHRMSPLATVKSLLTKPFMPAVFFLSGVIYDTVTLTRIDRLQDNLILLLYLAMLGALIVLTGRVGNESPPDPGLLATSSPFMRWVLESRPYYPMASQFLLGSLFSDSLSRQLYRRLQAIPLPGH